tara:strand:- start:200 stop:394 length:195 start_codon:yes stop_codon:yes gene_type:complete
MAKFICEKCESTIELLSHTIKWENNKVVSPEAMCCNDYMVEIKEKGKGFGGIIKRPGGTVSGKF